MPPRLRITPPARALLSQHHAPLRFVPSNPPPLSRPPPDPRTPFATRCRHYSHNSFDGSSADEDTQGPPPSPGARWASRLVARVGECVRWGCDDAQARRAAELVGCVAAEWRRLTAGAKGFLTVPGMGLEDQRVAWGEMDSFGHVNNTNYLRWAESARVSWITNFARLDPTNGDKWRALMTPTGVGVIMGTITARYKLPVTYPDTISAYHKLRAAPDATSERLSLECVILSHRHRRVAARTHEDVVVYDYAGGGGKARVPPWALPGLDAVWHHQLSEQAAARARIQELDGMVAELEGDTWDRPGAVEVTGVGERKGEEEERRGGRGGRMYFE
ncbi:thioesterase-like superfamily-domain-containing protein [Hypoxylon sp. FL1284]|nr:thioesterase-like superfamily-domain-containing protein [Hypoxylon sp. FL1284]